MSHPDNKFHLFDCDIAAIRVPQQFTYPFHYVPHRLSELAAEQVQRYLSQRTDWAEELSHGKMFGVLVVRDADGQIGFLAAFSGNLAHCNIHSYFVPPIFDLLATDGYFRPEESLISEINAKISQIEQCAEFHAALLALRQCQTTADKEISDFKHLMKESKALRDKRRADGANEKILIAESQFQKAELKRMRCRSAESAAQAQAAVDTFATRIAELKEERKRRSAALQRHIFHSFVVQNARGDTSNLSDIFHDTPQGIPPAGAGECAAPKLLQYAFSHSYRPIAMAEFWWGDSPTDVIRRHRHFYGACKSKCEPILEFMLRGLDVEPNDLEQESASSHDIKVIYEDEWIIVVSKPAGMLSVPGKLVSDSVASRITARYPGVEGPLIVHRLDMATSGLLILARTKAVHKALQSMFKSRRIEKRYVAWLDGEVEADSGEINLPLSLHPDDRPRQTVNQQLGKPAITRYEVTDRRDSRTRIIFRPITGRTHQLRVHAAHHLGLNAPIIGDRLYGKAADRLYLHAEAVEFRHPVTHAIVHIEDPAPF